MVVIGPVLKRIRAWTWDGGPSQLPLGKVSQTRVGQYSAGGAQIHHKSVEVCWGLIKLGEPRVTIRNCSSTKEFQWTRTKRKLIVKNLIAAFNRLWATEWLHLIQTDYFKPASSRITSTAQKLLPKNFTTTLSNFKSQSITVKQWSMTKTKRNALLKPLKGMQRHTPHLQTQLGKLKREKHSR